MSDPKSQWASLRTLAEMLTAADNVSRFEFYTTKTENGPLMITCRCGGLPGMSREEIEAIVKDLNRAIAPVRSGVEECLLRKVANQMRRFL